MVQRMMYPEKIRCLLLFMSPGPTDRKTSVRRPDKQIGAQRALDIRHLEDLVESLVNSSLAPSTLKVYARTKRYLSFCRDTHTYPLPLSEKHSCLFVTHLMEEGLQHSSIKGYLSAVRRLQIVAGLGDPFVIS